MKKKNFFCTLVFIFIACVFVLGGRRYIKQRSSTKLLESPKPATAVEEVVETADIVEEVVKTTSETIVDDSKAESKNEIDPNDIEERIMAYLDVGDIKKARSLFEEYEDCGISGSLLKEINMAELDAVLSATDEARTLYLDTYDVNAAKDVLANCKKKIGSDNESLNKYLKLFDSCKEVNLATMECVDSGATKPKFMSSATDTFGNVYYNVLRMDADGYACGKAYGDYYVANLDVNTLKATITPDKDLLIDGKDYHIAVLATYAENQDSVLIYESPAITKTTLPFEMVVDVGDAIFVTLANTQGNGAWGPLGSAYIVNPILFKKLTVEDFDNL